MEAALIRIVAPAIRKLAIVYIVFATAIATYNANDDEQDDDDGQSQHHANEPAGIRQIIAAHHNGSLGATRINLPSCALRVIVSIDGHDAELIYRIRLQTTNILIINRFLGLLGGPFRFTLDSVKEFNY